MFLDVYVGGEIISFEVADPLGDVNLQGNPYVTVTLYSRE